MSPRVLKRFIILLATLTVVMVIATDVLDGFLTKEPGDFETERGTHRLEDGELDEAMAHFNEALEESPNHRGALMGRALVYIQQERYGHAVRELDHLIDFLNETLVPDDRTGRGVLAAAYANRGIIRDRRGEYERALEDYIASLRVDDDTVAGPGVVHKILYGSSHVSTVRDRARYLYEQLQLPEAQRVMRVPEIDAQQRMHRP